MGRISIENGRIRYFGNTAGYIAGKRAVVDPIFSSEKLQAFLNRQNDVEEVEWRESMNAWRMDHWIRKPPFSRTSVSGSLDQRWRYL